MTLGRKTGGRKRGTLNKATVERELCAARGLQIATDEGILPLDVMLARLRDEPLPNGEKPTDAQFAAAVAAAPYIHPKLSAMAVQQIAPSRQFDLSGLTSDERQALAKLLRRVMAPVLEAAPG